MARLSTLIVMAAASVWVTFDAFSQLFGFGEPTRVVFDLPEMIECRDVSPPEFLRTHPELKVIEAKFRVSARFTAGSEAEIEDFLYIVASPDQSMRFQDYLPNTLLESSVADDQIEITDMTENAKGGEVGTHVGYEGIGGGVSRTKSSKTSHATHYKEIAQKDLIVAAGTTDHEHGVFFKLRPSRSASLEGAKEFSLLATVPRSWRAGWFTISCAARAKSKAFFSRSGVEPAGVAQMQVALYMLGDAEASCIAAELGVVQREHAAVLADGLERGGLLESIYDAASTGRTASLCGAFLPNRTRWDARDEVEAAKSAIADVQQRLQQLSQ